ncbi:MAG TPA: cupin domain-containing protein [Candidatus Obscuribacterales bacterium]
MAKIIDVRTLPLAANVCEQVLREVESVEKWSMAHVVMNPFASSLAHKHKKMVEIYIITRGCGELLVGDELHSVTAGSVFEIPAGIPHTLKNKGGGQLEHLVLAFPPFQPDDVILLEDEKLTCAPGAAIPLSLPEETECFDGARILPYAFPQLDLSVAFGRVVNDPARHKEPHFHKKITEFMFVVEGHGLIKLNGASEEIRAGNWIRIEPGVEHGLVNESFEDLVAVCICCAPAFDMGDVHYRAITD